jgi:hypothetical protein
VGTCGISNAKTGNSKNEAYPQQNSDQKKAGPTFLINNAESQLQR